MIRAHLSGGFTHDDTRHESRAGHVSGNPEFFVRDIVVASADVLLAIVIDDGGQVLHIAALRIDLPNRLDIRHDMRIVELVGFDNPIFASHNMLSFTVLRLSRAEFTPRGGRGGNPVPGISAKFPTARE
jgi:hypothetical protein